MNGGTSRPEQRKNMSEYTYSVIKSSWGIRIRLSAEVALLPEDRRESAEVSNGIWAELTVRGLDSDERRYLMDGVRMVAPQIREALGHDAPTLIRVVGVDYNPTDYQANALKYAMAGWAAKEFCFNLKPVGVSFDRAQNRYIFEEYKEP
jgi:hypothetical protein